MLFFFGLYFGICGPQIVSVKIARMPDHASRGFAFIEYETNEGANGALEKLDKAMVHDRFSLYPLLPA